jgi:hypothetical protein
MAQKGRVERFLAILAGFDHREIDVHQGTWSRHQERRGRARPAILCLGKRSDMRFFGWRLAVEHFVIDTLDTASTSEKLF